MDVDPGEDSLLSRARAGDPAAWRTLHDHLAGRLVVWLRTQPHLDASLDHEDIANEAWCTAAARIADFRGDLDGFCGWVFGIARNHMLNANRRTSRRQTSPTDVDPHDLVCRPQREDFAGATDQMDWIRGLLAQLPTREAEVVACLDVVGLDVASTAAALSTSANAVRVSHHRALRRLRSIVDRTLAADAEPLPVQPVVQL